MRSSAGWRYPSKGSQSSSGRAVLAGGWFAPRSGSSEVEAGSSDAAAASGGCASGAGCSSPAVATPASAAAGAPAGVTDAGGSCAATPALRARARLGRLGPAAWPEGVLRLLA